MSLNRINRRDVEDPTPRNGSTTGGMTSESRLIQQTERLAAGTPVIATKGAPWHALECEGCGWWVDHGVEPLVATLAEAMDMERGVLRANAKELAWMKARLSWDRVAHDILAVYGWLSSGSEVPGSVRLK